MLRARFGYNLYVGVGRADPGPAQGHDALAVSMRTGFGIEAARLMPEPAVEGILAVWRKAASPPTGSALPYPERFGRYVQPIVPKHEMQLERARVFGGGTRLVGQTPEEDMIIAALEGMFWSRDTDGAVFLPWVNDSRPRVAWTAARLLRLSPSSRIDLAAVLAELAHTHTDPGVRWHASDGLTRRSWEPRHRPPGPPRLIGASSRR